MLYCDVLFIFQNSKKHIHGVMIVFHISLIPHRLHEANTVFSLNISQFIEGINYGETDGHLTAHV